MADVVTFDLELCDGESGRCRADLFPALGGDWVKWEDYNAIRADYLELTELYASLDNRLIEAERRLAIAVRALDDFAEETPGCLKGLYAARHEIRAPVNESVVPESSTDVPNVGYDWTNEDPGSCPVCGKPWQMVRPGKSQPNCDCQ